MLTIGRICAILISVLAIGFAIYFYPKYKKHLMKSHRKGNAQNKKADIIDKTMSTQTNDAGNIDNYLVAEQSEQKADINQINPVNSHNNSNDEVVVPEPQVPPTPTHTIIKKEDGRIDLVLSSEEDGKIYIKIDNIEFVYESPISIDRNCAIEIWAFCNNQKSSLKKIVIDDFVTNSPEFVCNNNIVRINSEPGSQIYYTTDGTSPDRSSLKYSEDGIVLKKNTTISAIAISVGKKPSKIVSYKFVYLPSTSERIRVLTDTDNILGVSFQGDGHIKQSTPCQDCHEFSVLSHNWNLAIVSDGAGSAKLSDSGSKAVCAGFKFYIENLIQESELLQRGEILDASIWNHVFKSMLASFQSQLRAVAGHQKCSFKDLSATIILLLYNKNGYMAAHVGDGRGGICINGDWIELFTPHKGEEANQTYFSTADFSNPSLLANGIPVPETKSSKVPFDKFVLMSDGCENGCWTTYQRVELPDGDWKIQDVNKPRVQAIEDAFLIFEKPITERKYSLISFIKEYNTKMESETDDKTILFGINR